MAWKKEKENGRDNELSKRYENVEEEAKQGERNFLLSDLTEICLKYLIQNDLRKEFSSVLIRNLMCLYMSFVLSN